MKWEASREITWWTTDCLKHKTPFHFALGLEVTHDIKIAKTGVAKDSISTKGSELRLITVSQISVLTFSVTFKLLPISNWSFCPAFGLQANVVAGTTLPISQEGLTSLIWCLWGTVLHVLKHLLWPFKCMINLMTHTHYDRVLPWRSLRGCISSCLSVIARTEGQ